MTKLYIFVGIIAAIALVLSILKGEFGGKEIGRKKYLYRRKNFFLTRAEHEFYDALVQAIGNDFYIFAQVHLPTLLDHSVKGQNWRAALAHINRKSVDFVMCDKTYISPKLAIELDDITHERQERQERDREVESILKDAGVPLLRVENHGRFDPSVLSQKIKDALNGKKNQ